MQIGRIEGATRVLGKSQGFIPLPLRDVVVDDKVVGKAPAMETAWFPTLDELQAMVDGAPLILRVMGTAHPPVMLYVGDRPKEGA